MKKSTGPITPTKTQLIQEIFKLRRPGDPLLPSTVPALMERLAHDQLRAKGEVKYK